MIPHLRPVEHWGLKFDRGMTLFEFQAFREPERTQFPQIGAWLRAKGVEFNEVPTPVMLWNGVLHPDLFIANQLEAVPYDFYSRAPVEWQYCKSEWSNEYALESASISSHGEKFHDTFIETLCHKITGRHSSEISAKFHRSVWLPLFWPSTLRDRASIKTTFWYPCAGYAGAVKDALDGLK